MDGVPGAFAATARSITPPAAPKKKDKEPREDKDKDRAKPAAAVPTPAPAPAPAPAAWGGFSAPHPLLWVTLCLSILAIVLGVPKGSLPTITGRHRVLRAQEIQVAERLALLNQLSGFLPPPLAALLIPDPDRARALDLVRLGAGLQLWNAQTHTDTTGGWWTIEELDDGASVVRSAAGGREREVWVVRAADSVSEHGALLAALTSSLLSRERLYAELDRCRAEPCVCASANTAPAPRLTVAATPKAQPQPTTTVVVEAQAERDEYERAADERRRFREREIEVEDRERDVARREKWVVESMRKLAEKSQ
ncbi:hypothetical protein VHUM_00072 [Vanrija humicola]|uniref:Uncharacterized protein n=1 Tax=Vanrija humicola TaxID=5417 RepID=A0A7D8V4P2_VANHU|nr:hypothetical protein VHUM_00072 [Vanrija humicola]